MNEGSFESTDSARSEAPLKHLHRVTLEGGVDLERGGHIDQVTVAYETWGQLNDARDNAVLICHALSGDSHVARHDPQDDPGWWDLADVVGPGMVIDTDRYFVVCPNVLGGCRGTTGPNSIDPRTSKPYGPDFPAITIGDMVEVQARLFDHLGIETLLAVLGGSMGGHQTLCWGVKFPHRVGGAIVLAASPRLTAQSLAFDVVGRNAILSDPNFHDGQYYDKPTRPDTGLAIARMIGHITYLSPESMAEKFEADRTEPRDVPIEFEKRFSVGSYLGYLGTKFVGRFDANSYLALTTAGDLFDLGRTDDQLQHAIEPSQCRWLVISFTSDWLYPPSQSQQLVKAMVLGGKPVSYCNIAGDYGHDAFLLPDQRRRYGPLIRSVLADLSGQAPPEAESGENGSANSPHSIFHPEHPQRMDYQRIVEMIAPEASVLDLGCGDGSLLAILKQRGNAPLVGVDREEDAVVAAVSCGLNAIHADLNEGNLPFGDKQFDVVVLSRTLQAVRNVETVVDDMLRIGRKCIISFPNFGYHKIRTMLAQHGRAPVAGVLHYEWYDTPNIRVLSVADFEAFCQAKGIRVHRSVTFDTERDWLEVTDQTNLNADLAIFIISR